MAAAAVAVAVAAVTIVVVRPEEVYMFVYTTLRSDPMTCAKQRSGRKIRLHSTMFHLKQLIKLN